jgi:hypothetical protein
MARKSAATLKRISPDVPDDIAFPLMRQKLMASIEVTESGCWRFTGWKSVDGYGFVSFRAKLWRAHRLSYVLFTGLIPKGKEICHSCDNPPCINPAHLWAGTSKENHQDSVQKGRHYRGNMTHCKRGHPFNEENTLIVQNGRDCKTCRVARQKAYDKQRTKAARLARVSGESK